MASAQTSKKTSGKQSASGKTVATTKKQAAAGGARPHKREQQNQHRTKAEIHLLHIKRMRAKINIHSRN